MQTKVNFRKENEIRVFGFAMENSPKKRFPMFGNILKMLFSYKFYTFSQLLNKFYNRKFQNIHLTQPKFKIKISFIHKLGERRKKE